MTTLLILSLIMLVCIQLYLAKLFDNILKENRELKIENSKTGNLCINYSKCHGELKQKLEQLHNKFGMPLNDAKKFNGDNT